MSVIVVIYEKMIIRIWWILSTSKLWRIKKVTHASLMFILSLSFKAAILASLTRADMSAPVYPVHLLSRPRVSRLTFVPIKEFDSILLFLIDTGIRRWEITNLFSKPLTRTIVKYLRSIKLFSEGFRNYLCLALIRS